MMESAKIELASEFVKPLGTLHGKVQWQRSERPPSLELRVFWMTRGRGTEEVHVVTTEPVLLNPAGTAMFSMRLPELPWSFDGQLISVSWAVELVDDQDEGCALVEFVMSPDGVVRQLGEVKEPKSKGRGIRMKER
ncbi:hypothetical protein [Haloferula sp.]|uniref:hypothetical protein n=1 Tax=Haloferula sp. TaxID=2497595 RepID=UPI003C78726E